MIGVHAASPAYRTATAELPLRTVVATSGDVTGAIVVIDGAEGWPERARDAATRGAAALILADPSPPRGEESPVTALADRLPVVVDRAGLRADAVRDALRACAVPKDDGEGALAQPWALFSVSCVAPSGRFASVLADAVGWSRVLGGPLEPVAARGTADGVLAQVRGPAGRVSLTARVRSEPSAGSRIAVTAVAPRRLQLVVVPGATVSVRWSDEEGEGAVPTRFEGRERLSLRRALAALASAERPRDLPEFLADAEHARELAEHLLA